MNGTESYYEKTLQPLVDGKITGIAFAPAEYGEQYVGLVAMTDKGKLVAWADRDPEGNGPGHISLQEVDH